METRLRKSARKGVGDKTGKTAETVQQPTRRKDIGAGDASSPAVTEKSRMYQLCGFDWRDFSSWDAFVRLMTRPMDPASLAVMRIVYGLLMFLDTIQERGLAYADTVWGDRDECRFPLIHGLPVLPLQWMFMAYISMAIGSLGIMFGALYRISCFLFLVPYWYIFVLDKTAWNNHSYLFGLLSLFMLTTDADRMWSVDGLFRKKIKNAHVPLWNYCLFRSQIFLVYFIAGLKKLDLDWVQGYSMQRLASHWVFYPFKFILTEDQIDLLIVHQGGLIIDLSIGYLLFFDATRPLAFLMGGTFHTMNSQIFSIGMFPYAMLATMPLFCHVDWPRRLVRRLPKVTQYLLPVDEPQQCSSHCLYTKEQVKPEQQSTQDADTGTKTERQKSQKSSGAPPTKPGLYHKLVSVLTVLYLAEQCFLPYSHFLTKGYNNWTNGLYGYSWDMMVHSWSTQHIRVTYVNKDTGATGYLNPEAWTVEHRWSSHADMTKQYALCIEERLKAHNLKNISLHFDVWRSLNDRFQQRMFDPRVDIVTAEWHPLKETPWSMPLLTELSNWRYRLEEIEKTVYYNNNDTDVVFIADFPGLSLENYVQPDLGNTSIELLQGKVIVEIPSENKNVTLKEGEKIQVPAGEYHNVHTVSDQPSCYMYVFVNTTEKELAEYLQSYEQRITNKNNSKTTNIPKDKEDAVMSAYTEMKYQQHQMDQAANLTVFNQIKNWAIQKYLRFKRAFKMCSAAVTVIIKGLSENDLKEAATKLDKEIMDEELSFMPPPDPSLVDDVTDSISTDQGDAADSEDMTLSYNDISEDDPLTSNKYSESVTGAGAS